MHKLFAHVADLLFPKSARATRTIHIPRLVATPQRTLKESLVVLSCASYTQPHIKDAIGAAKFEHEPTAWAHLAALLDDVLLEEVFEDVLCDTTRPILAPISLSSARERARGYNQVHEIARRSRVVQEKYVEYIPNLLERTRDTTPQATLDKRARLLNMQGAFTLNPTHRTTIEGRTVYLLDDVVTTGATLSAGLEAISCNKKKAIALARA